MKKSIFAILLTIALVLSALPTGAAGQTPVSTATNYDLLEQFINANGEQDENGYMTIGLLYNDEESGYEYYLFLQNQGTTIRFSMMILGTTDPSVDSNTELYLTKDSTSCTVNFAMLFFYGGDYIDMVSQTTTLNRTTYVANQPQTVTTGGQIIPASDASEYFTTSLSTLCEVWDELLYSELGFGLKGLGFSSFGGYGDAVCDPVVGTHIGAKTVVGKQEATCSSDGYTGDIYCTGCNTLLVKGLTISDRPDHVYKDEICILCGHSTKAYTLTGSVTSYGGTGDVTITLLSNGNPAYTATVSGGDYAISNLAPGTYTLTVSKAHHAAREYIVTVEADVTQNVEIFLLGDTTGDGKVNMKDWSALYDHTSEVSVLTGYALQCADVNQDGKVNLKDWARLYDHISETTPLW